MVIDGPRGSAGTTAARGVEARLPRAELPEVHIYPLNGSSVTANRSGVTMAFSAHGCATPEEFNLRYHGFRETILPAFVKAARESFEKLSGLGDKELEGFVHNLHLVIDELATNQIGHNLLGVHCGRLREADSQPLIREALEAINRRERASQISITIEIGEAGLLLRATQPNRFTRRGEPWGGPSDPAHFADELKAFQEWVSGAESRVEDPTVLAGNGGLGATILKAYSDSIEFFPERREMVVRVPYRLPDSSGRRP